MLMTINDQDPRPVYAQIVNQVKDQIQRGELKPGDELPSVRELASNLGINLHTVRRAYGVLREQQILTFRWGQQARVARLRSRPASNEEVSALIGERLRELITDAFLLGLTPDHFRSLVNAQIARLEEPSR